MLLSIIAAMDENRVIGVAGRLPWHLSDDLKRFRRITMGKPIIMGRRTHKSIGKVLDGRSNIVVTRDPAYRAPGCVVVHSLGAALEAGAGSEEVVVVGGGSIYAEALPRADRLYLTFVHDTFRGDVYFPEIDPGQWDETEREEFPASRERALAHAFVVLDRVERPGTRSGRPA